MTNGWQAPPKLPTRKVSFALGTLGMGIAWFIQVQNNPPQDVPPPQIVYRTDVKTQTLEKEVPRELSRDCMKYLDAVPVLALGLDRISDQMGTVDRQMRDLPMRLYDGAPASASREVQEHYRDSSSTMDAIWLEMSSALYEVHKYDGGPDPCRQEDK
jgi:hypothetical protein